MNNKNIRFWEIPNHFTSRLSTIIEKFLFSIGVSNMDQKLRDVGHLPWQLLVKSHEVMVNVCDYVFTTHTKPNELTANNHATEADSNASWDALNGRIHEVCTNSLPTFKHQEEVSAQDSPDQTDPMTYHCFHI